MPRVYVIYGYHVPFHGHGSLQSGEEFNRGRMHLRANNAPREIAALEGALSPCQRYQLLVIRKYLSTLAARESRGIARDRVRGASLPEILRTGFDVRFESRLRINLAARARTVVKNESKLRKKLFSYENFPSCRGKSTSKSRGPRDSTRPFTAFRFYLRRCF